LTSVDVHGSVCAPNSQDRSAEPEMSLSIPWSTSPWPLLQEAAEQGAVVVLPLGATEQHGPHLPVETDSLIATRMATRAAELTGAPVVVGPTVPFGYSHYHLHLAGTVSLRRETLAGLLLDVCRSIHAHGFERLLLLNAHGGNAPGMESAVTELAEDGLFVAAASWWSFAGDVLEDVLESAAGGANHACELETSVMLHLAPELVRMDRAIAELGRAESSWGWRDFRGGERNGPVSFPITPLTRSQSGVYGDPTLATAAKGERIVSHVAGRLAQLLQEIATWRPEQAPQQSASVRKGADR
jgi:creatinine amidohydrolase